MHVVITGGCGFIGSALVQHVITERADWTITVVDNKSSGQRIIDHPSVAVHQTQANGNISSCC